MDNQTVKFDEYLEKLEKHGICPYCNEQIVVIGCHGICDHCGYEYGCGD
jgi:predicted amidophosphoribosyltransferase